MKMILFIWGCSLKNRMRLRRKWKHNYRSGQEKFREVIKMAFDIVYLGSFNEQIEKDEEENED